MRITSTHLSHRSDERRSPDILPILVRRLISAISKINAMRCDLKCVGCASYLYLVRFLLVLVKAD